MGDSVGDCGCWKDDDEVGVEAEASIGTLKEGDARIRSLTSRLLGWGISGEDEEEVVGGGGESFFGGLLVTSLLLPL